VVSAYAGRVKRPQQADAGRWVRPVADHITQAPYMPEAPVITGVFKYRLECLEVGMDISDDEVFHGKLIIS